MKTVHAIYSHGVFRPVDSVELPESCEVEFEPRIVRKPAPADMRGVYEVLSERYRSGESDVASRHDEHQP